MTLFVPKEFDVKLNFCCNEFKFKLNWFICANTIDVVKNFAVIKNVAIKCFHCISSLFSFFEPQHEKTCLLCLQKTKA